MLVECLIHCSNFPSSITSSSVVRLPAPWSAALSPSSSPFVLFLVVFRLHLRCRFRCRSPAFRLSVVFMSLFCYTLFVEVFSLVLCLESLLHRWVSCRSLLICVMHGSYCYIATSLGSRRFVFLLGMPLAFLPFPFCSFFCRGRLL